MKTLWCILLEMTFYQLCHNCYFRRILRHTLIGGESTMFTCAQCAVANNYCEIIASPWLQLCSHITSIYNFFGKQYFVRYQMCHCDSLGLCRQRRQQQQQKDFKAVLSSGSEDFKDGGCQIQLQMLVNITYIPKIAIGQLVLIIHYFQVNKCF